MGGKKKKKTMIIFGLIITFPPVWSYTRAPAAGFSAAPTIGEQRGHAVSTVSERVKSFWLFLGFFCFELKHSNFFSNLYIGRLSALLMPSPTPPTLPLAGSHMSQAVKPVTVATTQIY